MTEHGLPEEIKVLYDKASLAVHQKNYNYAIELLTRAINIKPDFVKGRQLLRLAEIKKFNENPPAMVIRLIRRVLSFIYMFIAFISESVGKRHEAISTYEKILKNDPKNSMALVKLGNILKIEGMKEASAVTLESAINISPKNIIAYELLGEIYSGLGNYGRARLCFKKVLELKPHDANADKALKNLDALTTIDKSFDKKDAEDFRIREITE